MTLKATSLLATILVASVLCADSANAITITVYGSTTGDLDPSHHFVNGTFTLGSGYNSPSDINPGSDTLNSASVSFTFRDYSGLTSVNIDLGSLSVTTGTSVFAVNTLGELSFNVTGSAWDQLAESGVIAYTASWSSGDSIYLQSSSLTADVSSNPPVNSVPDGGTSLSLLGLALTGMGFARQQLKA